MKTNLFFYLILLCIFLSCKKDPGKGEIAFDVFFSRLSDTTLIDSAVYLKINYIDNSEIKDSSNYYSPSFYNQSIKLELSKPLEQYQFLRSENFTLNAGRTYVVKSFEITDLQGNTLYYIPYQIPPAYQTNIDLYVMQLPYSFKVNSNDIAYSSIVVIRK